MVTLRFILSLLLQAGWKLSFLFLSKSCKIKVKNQPKWRKKYLLFFTCNWISILNKNLLTIFNFFYLIFSVKKLFHFIIRKEPKNFVIKTYKVVVFQLAIDFLLVFKISTGTCAGAAVQRINWYGWNWRKKESETVQTFIPFKVNIKLFSYRMS